MSSYRFLLTRRWLGLGFILTIAAITCFRLGVWQHDRHEYKVDRAEQINAYYDADPLPLGDVIATSEAADSLPAQWQHVLLEGEFVGAAVLAPHRPVTAGAADHALGIFHDEPSGRYIAINRGWLPTDVFNDPTAQIALPQGHLTLNGHIRLSEPVVSSTIIAGQVRSMNPGLIWVQAMGEEQPPPALLTEIYVQIGTDASAAANSPDLNRHDRPDTGLGNHFSYAMQWWVFGLGCIIGYVILARREAQEGSEGSPATTVVKPAKAEHRSRKRVGSRDADAEDKLIDAQLGQ